MGGVLYSRTQGKTRVYGLNPRYSFRVQLEALLDKALVFYPAEERERLMMIRRRPRRKGKPHLVGLTAGATETFRIRRFYSRYYEMAYGSVLESTYFHSIDILPSGPSAVSLIDFLFLENCRTMPVGIL